MERVSVPRETLTVQVEEVGYELRPILGGWCVKRVSQRHCVDVVKMLYNWRLVRSCRAPGAPHLTMDRGWCYAGTGLAMWYTAVEQAVIWDGADTTQPEGWIKRAL